MIMIHLPRVAAQGFTDMEIMMARLGEIEAAMIAETAARTTNMTTVCELWSHATLTSLV